MPYDEKGRFWTAKIDGVFKSGDTCYKPPPDREDDPPPPMFEADQETIDKWDKEHNLI